MRFYRTRLRPHNLTEQQWRILRALSDVPHLEVSELARAATLLGPSLSRILKDMERRGLVVRTADMEDMRKSHIALSDSGRNLFNMTARGMAAVDLRIAEAFGGDRQDQLLDLLILLENLQVLELPGFPAGWDDE